MKKINLIIAVFICSCASKKIQYTVTRYGIVPTSVISKRLPTKDILSNGDTLYCDYKTTTLAILKRSGDTVYITEKP